MDRLNTEPELALVNWMADAAPGESYVYASEVANLDDCGKSMEKVIRLAWRYSEDGLVKISSSAEPARARTIRGRSTTSPSGRGNGHD